MLNEGAACFGVASVEPEPDEIPGISTTGGNGTALGSVLVKVAQISTVDSQRQEKRCVLALLQLHIAVSRSLFEECSLFGQNI